MNDGADTTKLEDAESPFFIGVDVGGTAIKIGLIDDRGRTIRRDKIDTAPQRGPASAVERAAELVRRLLADADLQLNQDVPYVGLGTPGTMDIPRGLLLEPPNLPGWENFPIRDRLRDALDGTPVAFANDAGAAAYGEYWVGSGADFGSIVMLTLGTGVGGGIIVGDRSIDGENSHGSECGHIIIDSRPDARRCSCGQPGHLEGYASATAVVARTREALASGRPSSLEKDLQQGTVLNGLLVAQHAESGDALAREIVMETAEYLAIGITSLVHTIDPGAVVLGGAMDFGGHDHPLGREFLEQVRKGFRQRAFPVPAERTVIDFARLGGDAGYIGAAGIARSAYARLPRT